ncbi:MAG TPA: YkvA family protein [Noviherbaspirillum sp.]|nr:YkvA family protein [Noviherbaspirillum sp.]
MLLRLGRLFRTVGRDILVLWYACRHPATPRLMKFLALLLAVYIVSPLDLIPDWLAVFGWVDDISLIALGIPALLKLMPESAVRDARAAAGNWLARPGFRQQK